MNRISLIHSALSVVVIVGIWGQTHPALGSIPLLLDVSDGYTFSGNAENLSLSDTVSAPLGPNFAIVPTLIELIQQNSVPGEFRAIFPDQGGQTILIDNGDPIRFEYLFEGIPFLARLTALGAPGFGGGLGSTIELTTTADMKGSGEGVANINLPNLGFLEETNFMSLLLGNSGGVFAQHGLGVDLNGDGMNNTVTIPNLIATGADFLGTSPGWDYEPMPEIVLGLPLFWDDHPFRPESALTVNPSVGLTFDIDEWTMTQDLLVPAVPEASSLVMLTIVIIAANASSSHRWCSRRVASTR